MLHFWQKKKEQQKTKTKTKSTTKNPAQANRKATKESHALFTARNVEIKRQVLQYEALHVLIIRIYQNISVLGVH